MGEVTIGTEVIWLASIIIGVFLAGFLVMFWLVTNFARKADLHAFEDRARAARETVDVNLRLHMAENYMTKATAIVVNERFVSEIHGMRTDLSTRLQHIERRLMTGFGIKEDIREDSHD